MRKTLTSFLLLYLLTTSCSLSPSKPLIATQPATVAMSATPSPTQTATTTPTETPTTVPTNSPTPTATPTPAGIGLDNFDEFVQVHKFEADLTRALEEITDPSISIEVTFTTYSSDGKYFAAGGGLSPARGIRAVKVFVVILDARTGERVGLIALKGERVNSLSFSSDGKKLAYAVASQGWQLSDIAIWDIESNQIDRVLLQAKANDYDNPKVAFQPHGNQIVVVSMGNLTVWDSVSGEKVANIPQYEKTWYELLLGFNASGTSFAFEVRKNSLGLPVKVVIYDTSTWEELSRIKYAEFNESTAYSPDGKWIVTALQEERKILIWDAETGEQTRTLDNIINYEIKLSFSPDSRLLFATGFFPIDSELPMEASQAVAIVWDTSTWQMAGYFNEDRSSFTQQGELGALQFTADGRSFHGDKTDLLFALPGATYLESQQQARQVVRDFQSALGKGDYEAAAALVDSTRIPQDFIDHDYGSDPLSILKSLCEHKSHPCLSVKNIYTDTSYNLFDGNDFNYNSSEPPNSFDFIIQLENPDGSTYQDKGGRYDFHLGLILSPDGKNYQIRLGSIISYGIYW